MDQTAKQANPKVPNYAVNFKKNGKTMNADELSKGGSAVGSSADQTVATPYYSPQSDSNGNGSGPNKQLKHSPYTSMTAASEQQRVEETTRDEAQMVNKFLANLGPPPASVQRKGMSNEVKASGIISGAGVGPPMASSVTNGMPSESQGLYELLASIDGRVQKLQDSLMYYRNAPKPPMVHSSLNPIFTNYLSLIKAQVLNIESTIEAKFSNIEHKFSNVEIEDGIWKKTINWKLEEITSKVSFMYFPYSLLAYQKEMFIFPASYLKTRTNYLSQMIKFWTNSTWLNATFRLSQMIFSPSFYSSMRNWIKLS